ncbi:Competence protein ComM [compost metagenome]
MKYGPPGAGKTMLAKRLPSILPPLSLGEALETTRIHSVSGKQFSVDALVTARPFRALPQPGEISLAHNGVNSSEQ